jgi:hypothetical protein
MSEKMRMHCCPACGKHLDILVSMLLGRKRLSCNACKTEVYIILPVAGAALASGGMCAVVQFVVSATIQTGFWVRSTTAFLTLLIGVTAFHIRFCKLSLTKPVAPSIATLRRFHLSTAIAVSIFAGLLLYANFGMGQAKVYGWPFDVFAQSSISFLAVIGDVLVSAFILFAVTVFCELLISESTIRRGPPEIKIENSGEDD